VLIAAFVESHPKHKSALSFLMKAKNKEFELFVSSHTILEIYSVLTGAPFKPKITPIIAKQY
jgi:predicted nucleic acid-binding protein